jgi:predicted nuclease of predicted toxin-antitoxin system
VRILFDENVPFPLQKFFPDDVVATVQQQGWSGMTNGELVQCADGNFDVLVLADKNLRYQQNLSQRQIAFVELPTNRWPLLVPLAPRIVAAVSAALPGGYTILEL